MAVFAQDRGAKRVHRGDLRHGKARGLALQMAVFRVTRQTLCQLLRDLSAQLRCGGFCIGDDEKIVHIRGALVVADQPQHTIDEHARLARARRGGHEQRAAGIFHDRLLRGRQNDLSHGPHLHRPASRIFRHSPCGSGAPPAAQGRGDTRHKNRKIGSSIPVVRARWDSA